MECRQTFIALAMNPPGRLTITVSLDFVRSPAAGKIYAALPSARGAIAQLGERIVRNDEVVGSIPTSSTKLFNHLPVFALTFHH